jgi:hypothetical protein
MSTHLTHAGTLAAGLSPAEAFSDQMGPLLATFPALAAAVQAGVLAGVLAGRTGYISDQRGKHADRPILAGQDTAGRCFFVLRFPARKRGRKDGAPVTDDYALQRRYDGPNKLCVLSDARGLHRDSIKQGFHNAQFVLDEKGELVGQFRLLALVAGAPLSTDMVYPEEQFVQDVKRHAASITDSFDTLWAVKPHMQAMVAYTKAFEAQQEEGDDEEEDE